jgi:hypothetical protein
MDFENCSLVLFNCGHRAFLTLTPIIIEDTEDEELYDLIGLISHVLVIYLGSGIIWVDMINQDLI